MFLRIFSHTSRVSVSACGSVAPPLGLVQTEITQQPWRDRHEGLYRHFMVLRCCVLVLSVNSPVAPSQGLPSVVGL